jgi:hypothetical protein
MRRTIPREKIMEALAVLGIDAPPKIVYTVTMRADQVEIVTISRNEDKSLKFDMDVMHVIDKE